MQELEKSALPRVRYCERTALPRNVTLNAVLKSPLSFYGIYVACGVPRVRNERERERERRREKERAFSISLWKRGRRRNRDGKHCMPNQTTVVDSALCVRSICRFPFNNVICMQGYIIFSRLLLAFRSHPDEEFPCILYYFFPRDVFVCLFVCLLR